VKYHCPVCEGVFESSIENDVCKYTCPACHSIFDWSTITLPDWETPEHYEARTGKPYPDNGLVWVYNLIRVNKWFASEYHFVKNYEKREVILVVANPPFPPPGDWRPT